MDSCAIAGLRCPNQKGILKRATVYEKLSPASGGLSIARALDKPTYLKGPGGILNRYQGSRHIAPPDGSQPLGCIVLWRHR
jgi:hypothetical protein